MYNKLYMSYFDYIPNEILCQVASELTDPKDIHHFMTTFKNATEVVKECVIKIIANYPIKGAFVLKFSNLKEVRVPKIITNTMDEFIFLQFMKENNNGKWKYYLEYPPGYDDIYLQLGPSSPAELYAYLAGYDDTYIINLFEQRNITSRNEVGAKLLALIFNSRSLNLKLIAEILRLSTDTQYIHRKQVGDKIFMYAFGSYHPGINEEISYELLELLRNYNYTIAPRILDNALIIASEEGSLEIVFPVIQYIIETGMFPTTSSDFLLMHYLQINNFDIIKWLVDNNVTVTQEVIDYAVENELDDQIINYLRQYLSE